MDEIVQQAFYLYLRPEVRRFAQMMETQLRSKDASRGNSWKGMNIMQLRKHLYIGLAEFEAAIALRKASSEVEFAATDVANYLMFSSENYRRDTTNKVGR